MRIVKPALACVLPVFALAFCLGALRVTLVATLTGPLAAVALEVPVVLALAWAVAGAVLLRRRRTRRAGSPWAPSPSRCSWSWNWQRPGLSARP